MHSAAATHDLEQECSSAVSKASQQDIQYLDVPSGNLLHFLLVYPESSWSFRDHLFIRESAPCLAKPTAQLPSKIQTQWVIRVPVLNLGIAVGSMTLFSFFSDLILTYFHSGKT